MKVVSLLGSLVVLCVVLGASGMAAPHDRRLSALRRQGWRQAMDAARRLEEEEEAPDPPPSHTITTGSPQYKNGFNVDDLGGIVDSRDLPEECETGAVCDGVWAQAVTGYINPTDCTCDSRLPVPERTVIYEPTVTQELTLVQRVARACAGAASSVARAIRWMYLLFGASGQRRTLPNTGTLAAQSPFHNLNVNEFPYFMRLMWWGSQYAYVKNNHYRTSAGVEQINTVEHTTRLESANADDEKADAQVAIFDGSAYTPPTGMGMHPDVWYCRKYFTPEWCGEMTTHHVAFRGMQLSFRLTTPPIGDLINMKGNTAEITCDFRLHVTGRGPVNFPLRITEGVCLIMKSLVGRSHPADGAADDGLLAKLYLWTLANKANKNIVMFQGLSFGGALAQVGALLYNGLLDWMLGARILTQAEYDNKRTAVFLFGAPRVGGTAFAEGFQGYIGEGRIHADQFIMFTHLGREMAYDPIAMFPKELSAVGNIHTLEYHKVGNTLTTAIRHDLAVPPGGVEAGERVVTVGAGAPRMVPKSTIHTFNCLHLFPKYKAFGEAKALSRGWCRG